MIIDPDYRGEWLVPLYNDSKETQIIHAGDRIAQIVFIPFTSTDFTIVDELSDTNRGAGGFGSTGGC